MNKDDTEGTGQIDCLGVDSVIQSGRGGRRKTSCLKEEQCTSFGTHQIAGTMDLRCR